MRRVLLAVVLALLALPATARAVTVTEFELPAYHAPLNIIAHPGGYLAYSFQGTYPTGGVGRISTSGALMPGLPNRSDSTAPSDLIAADGVVYTVGQDGLTLRSETAAVALTTSATGTATSLDALVDDAGDDIVYSATLTGGAVAMCKVTCTTGLDTQTITALALAPDGHVWGLQPSSNRLVRLTTSGDAPVVDQLIPLPSAPAGSYRRLAIGPDGNVWVPGPGDAIQRVTQSGQRDAFALPDGTRPADVTAGPDGALWIAGSGNATIVRMTTAGQVTTVVPIPSGHPPNAITTGPDGAIWFIQTLYLGVGRLTLDPTTAGGPGGATGGTTGTLVRDTVRPRFVRTPSFAPASVRRGRDAKLRVQLSEPARLKVALGKATTGRRVHGACVKTTHRNRSRSRCTRYPTAKTLTKAGIAGANTITVPTTGLHTGSYRATVTATDTAGNTSTPATAGVRIVRR